MCQQSDLSPLYFDPLLSCNKFRIDEVIGYNQLIEMGSSLIGCFVPSTTPGASCRHIYYWVSMN